MFKNTRNDNLNVYFYKFKTFNRNKVESIFPNKHITLFVLLTILTHCYLQMKQY